MTEPAVRRSPDSIVDHDLPCVKCGYNLRTLPWDGVCTECGTRVRSSVAPDGFRFSDARAARCISRGIAIWSVAVLLAGVGYIAWFFALRYNYFVPFRIQQTVFTLLSLPPEIGGLLRAIAVWFLLVPQFPFRAATRSRLDVTAAALMLVAVVSILHSLFALLSRPAYWGSFEAANAARTGAGVALWLAFGVAWLRLAHHIYPERQSALRTTVRVGAVALLIVLISQAIMFVGGIGMLLDTSWATDWFVNRFWWIHPRFTAWWPSGAIEGVCEIVILGALLYYLRRLRAGVGQVESSRPAADNLS